MLTSIALDPGEYTLRIAAVDDAGRGGSVHHSINARLNKGPNGINVSDLMLVPQPPVAGELAAAAADDGHRQRNRVGDARDERAPIRPCSARRK